MAQVSVFTPYVWCCPFCDTSIKAFESAGIFPNAMRHLSDVHETPWLEASALASTPEPPEKRIWAFNVH